MRFVLALRGLAVFVFLMAVFSFLLGSTVQPSRAHSKVEEPELVHLRAHAQYLKNQFGRLEERVQKRKAQYLSRQEKYTRYMQQRHRPWSLDLHKAEAKGWTQVGQAGVIVEILRNIGVTNKFCVEIGFHSKEGANTAG